MALGNNPYNNNDKKQYQQEVYSTYRMSNTTSSLDKTRLSFSYWNKLLKISISPLLGVENDIPKWDTNNTINVYINHSKAYLLANAIKRVLNGECASEGVVSNTKYLIVSNGQEFGINGYCLIIADKDPNTGSIVSSIAYEFKTNYHYTVVNFNVNSNQEEKAYDDTLELYELIHLLETYYMSASGADSYFVYENAKYDNSRTQTKLNSICEKLGIEFSNKANTSNHNSIYNNNNNSNNNFTAASPDDIENEIG